MPTPATAAGNTTSLVGASTRHPGLHTGMVCQMGRETGIVSTRYYPPGGVRGEDGVVGVPMISEDHLAAAAVCF